MIININYCLNNKNERLNVSGQGLQIVGMGLEFYNFDIAKKIFKRLIKN